LAGIRIPDSALDALGTLISVPDQVMNELLSAVADVPVSLNSETIRRSISSKVKSVTPDGLDKLIQLLLTLNATRGHFDEPVPEFVNDVLDAMARSGRKELQLSRIVKGIKTRKISLFPSPALAASQNAGT
jgi:hypothetical protein